jgi:hypothetical protein
MKKLTAILITIPLILTLSACSSTASENSQTEESVSSQPKAGNMGTSEQSGENNSEADTENTDTGIIVVYFSATGTTQPIAEKIAEILSADLCEIVPENPYTDEDLNYNNDSCRANKEQNDSTVRPGISNIDEINVEQYDIVLIGHPIWWGEEPRILDTFIESVDLSDKTVVNFCTSGGSGISTATEHLQELSPDAHWLEGHRFRSDVSDTEINEWLESLNMK